jgi:hypothetical protein
MAVLNLGDLLASGYSSECPLQAHRTAYQQWFPSWLAWMLKLTMTPSLGHLKPAIILDRFENLGYFHLIA